MGANIVAYTARELTTYNGTCLKEDVPKLTEILSDMIQNSKLRPDDVEREKSVIIREETEVYKAPQELVFDNLHAVAFQGEDDWQLRQR